MIHHQKAAASSVRYFEPQIEFLCAKHAFNFLMNDHLVSTPGHIASQLVTNYIYDISPTGAHANSLDFSALFHDFSKCAPINIILHWCQIAQSPTVLLSDAQLQISTLNELVSHVISSLHAFFLSFLTSLELFAFVLFRQIDIDAISPESWLSIEKLNEIAESDVFGSLEDVLGIIAHRNNHFFSLFFDRILTGWFKGDPMGHTSEDVGFRVPVVPVNSADELRLILSGLTSAIVIKRSPLSSIDLKFAFHDINHHGVLTLASIVAHVSPHQSSSSSVDTNTAAPPSSSSSSESATVPSSGNHNIFQTFIQPHIHFFFESVKVLFFWRILAHLSISLTLIVLFRVFLDIFQLMIFCATSGQPSLLSSSPLRLLFYPMHQLTGRTLNL
jgi:hypothetical protein